MNLTKSFFLTFFIAIILYGCAGDKQDGIAKIKPEKTEVSGDLQDYIQVLDNEYEVTENFGGHLSIKIKALKPFPAKEINGKTVQLSASLLQSNGAPVSGAGIFYSNNNEELLSFLKKGVGETVINMSALITQYRADEHAEKSKKFVVSSEIKEEEKQVETNSQNTTLPDGSTNAKGSKNWDKLLDDYEKYVNSYLQLLQKVQDGDKDAMNEYMDVLKTSTDLQTSLIKAQQDNNLSIEQSSRLNTLMLKLGSGMKN